jgi:nucleoside-diphosphate-sugar epimerase
VTSSASTISTPITIRSSKKRVSNSFAPTRASRSCRPIWRIAPGAAELFARHRFGVVVHLAAQAGVRYSIEHPDAYVDANLQLKQCAGRISAQSMPLFALRVVALGIWRQSQGAIFVGDNTDQPVSFSAATKKANEMMAYS